MACTKIIDVPIPGVYEQIIYPQRQTMIGRQVMVVHLTSSRGQQLNGKLVKVVGFDRDLDECRIHVELPKEEEEEEVKEDNDENMVEEKKTKTKKKKKKKQNRIKLKASNVLPPTDKIFQAFMSQSQPLSDQVIIQKLKCALKEHDPDTIDRSDFLVRLGMYRQLLNKLETAQQQAAETSSGGQQPNSANLLTNENDYCFPCGGGLPSSSEVSSLGQMDNLTRILILSKKACVGSNVLDVRYMDVGLKGDDDTACSICSETIVATDQQLILLPCVHIFHQGCIEQWLKSELGTRQWNCPTCRALVPANMETYKVNYKKQLQDRFNEYPISGYCTKCIISNMESLRNDPTGFVNGDGNDLVQGCVGQTHNELLLQTT